MARPCQKHWDMLREEVKRLGMADFVSASGEIAAARMAAEINDEREGKPESLENFDPLGRVYWMIQGRTMEIAGPMAIDDRFGCPICVFNASINEDGSCRCTDPDCSNKQPGSIPNFETWIVGPDSATQAVHDMMVENGWLKE